jgi:dUTP pyrophosphatase
MDKREIEEYIKRLQDLENEILNEESDDMSFIGDLNKLLNSLGDDIKEQVSENVNKFEVKIKRTHKDAVIPSYSKDGDAGLDLIATEVLSNTTTDVTYGTGISIEIPKGYVGLLFPRSSIRNYDISLSNCVGVIDSGYRGEIQATFKKTEGLDSFKYKKGDRIAQLIILPFPKISFIEVDELTSTDRGQGGFGSTGT